MSAKKPANKPGERVTASKRIIIASYAIGAVLTAAVITGAFMGADMSAIGMVTAAAYAEIAAGNAFYFNKAKKENVLKIALAAVRSVPADKADDIAKMVGAIGGIL